MEMDDKAAKSRTYARSSNYEKGRLLSQMFDRVSQDARKSGPPLKKAKSLSNIIQDSDVKMDSDTDLGHALKERTNEVSYCGLFESPTPIESLPKKAKQTTIHCKTLNTKKGIKRSTKHKTKMTSPSLDQENLRDAVFMHTSGSDLPGIETFRDLKQPTAQHKFPHRDVEASHGKSSLSMSDSFPELLTVDDTLKNDRKQPQTPFCFAQPWCPAGVRQRSYVNIKSSMSSSGEIVMSNISSVGMEEEGKENDNSSSYTSIYTWTTATATNTGVNTNVGVIPANKASDGGLHKASVTDCSSPSLVLKSYCQDNLHSTAIHSMADVDMQYTPHVSPIRKFEDGNIQQLTPVAPTHDVLPRGPRKTHSFISKSGRSSHPKCSTMLFSSTMADAGDAPLDVSSIREALCEEMDAGGGASSMLTNKQGNTTPRKHEDLRMPALTSTPLGCGHEKLVLDLSSVQGIDDEDELAPLRVSSLIVNSQEIVADSLSDASSVGMSGDQEGQKQVHTENAVNANSNTAQSFVRERDKVQNRSEKEKFIAQQDHKIIFDPEVHFQEEREAHFQQECIPSAKQSQAGIHMETNEREAMDDVDMQSSSDDSDSPQLPSVAAPNGDHTPATERASKLPTNQLFYHSLTTKLPSNMMIMTASKRKLINQSPIGQSRSAKQVSHAQAASKRKMPDLGGGEKEEMVSRKGEDDVDVCPISTLGIGDGHVPKIKEHKPHLLVCVEPYDSGFLDMTNSVPPDIIGVMSKQIKDKLSSQRGQYFL